MKTFNKTDSYTSNSKTWKWGDEFVAIKMFTFAKIQLVALGQSSPPKLTFGLEFDSIHFQCNVKI